MEYFGRYETDHDIFKCPVCATQLEGLQTYFDHTSDIHNVFICHECLKNFTTRCSLLRHRPIHHGIKRYSCSICSQKFPRRDKCKVHIRKKHDGEGTVDDVLGLFQCTDTPPPKDSAIVLSNNTVGEKNIKIISTEMDPTTDYNPLGKALSNLKKIEYKDVNGGFKDSNSSSHMDLWHHRDPYLEEMNANTDTNSLPELTVRQVTSHIGDAGNIEVTELVDLGDNNSTTYHDLDNSKPIPNEFVLPSPEKTYAELTSFNNDQGKIIVIFSLKICFRIYIYKNIYL